MLVLRCVLASAAADFEVTGLVAGSAATAILIAAVHRFISFDANQSRRVPHVEPLTAGLLGYDFPLAGGKEHALADFNDRLLRGLQQITGLKVANRNVENHRGS
jgi:hypothetical protein